MRKVTSKLESIKLEPVELEKCNTIVKCDLAQTKQKLEKLYTNSDKIEEQICAQRSNYDKTWLGFFLGQSAKKSIERKESDTPEFYEDIHKIDDTSKEKENITHFEKVKKSDQDMDNKRKESYG